MLLEDRCKWDPNKPLISYDLNIRTFFSLDAFFLLGELRENKLHVVLAPAPEPKHENHMVRKVESSNPEWYSILHEQYKYFRRERVVCALQRISQLKDRPYREYDDPVPDRFKIKYKYDSILRDLIFERLTKGYNCQGHEIPPNKEVRNYFGLLSPDISSD